MKKTLNWKIHTANLFKEGPGNIDLDIYNSIKSQIIINKVKV